MTERKNESGRMKQRKSWQVDFCVHGNVCRGKDTFVYNMSIITSSSVFLNLYRNNKTRTTDQKSTQNEIKS